ncbi:efflux RND transporter periplasmic adaptor subunit [Solimicrobium silvestre]|uniref:Efflux transporter, RND family, MFP subunit n=1 Tax=Solimicrobium silvestre TaxID=2099400 RepID=A0A2S9H285_9BURK|nr:efflux RND transporter periplasmic adaptor subunit [Solimicrobium silvestre]PRC94101.1 Efflux transporter, RND family, MFP subunit [Solimicrobium silvestre]
MKSMQVFQTLTKGPRAILLGLGLLVVLFAVMMGSATKSAPIVNAKPVILVESVLASKRDLPIYITGLGAVQAFYTVTISPRIDGELMKLGFTEGQMVKPGDLLAQIDPRPYQAALDQAVAGKAKDVAQLANAKIDLERYQSLAPEEFTSKQTLETQRALVAQTVAQIAVDDAAIDSAKTQLSYATIRSPIAGRTGIRLADPGNILHSATASGIVVVTQVQPISVIFTLPAESLQVVHSAMSAATVSVSAVSRDGSTLLGVGTLGLIDNQIDPTTGTMKLKATFPNQDNRLWPGDFVNARVLVETRHDAITIPSSAIQRGPDGVFAYVVKKDNTVEMRSLKLGAETDGVVIVEQGLQEGERVTTNNQYRLQPKVHVQFTDAVNRVIGTKAP